MDASEIYQNILKEVGKKISGNTEIIELMFIALIANGHALLEGVPGVAKTTMAKALADTVQANFGRIQGTVDLEVKDIIGFSFIDQATNRIKLRKGPIFTNILLIDELNRAPPKVTTALLEALEERQVTLGDETLHLEEPFIAFATQNPLNIEGTNPLPKVLTDRFLMRIGVGYPTMEEEEEMLRIKESATEAHINKVIGIDEILNLQKEVLKVSVPKDVIDYIARIVNATRTDMHVVMGGSPRAEISFMRCGKARALINNRKEVTIEDIKKLSRPVLSHRIVVRSTGGIGVNGIIDGIIASVN